MDVSPVLVVFQALPQHCHDLIAGHHVVGQIREVSHLRAGRAPRVIGRRLSHLQKEAKQERSGNTAGSPKVRVLVTLTPV